MVQPFSKTSHTFSAGSPLPRAIFVNDVGYLPDGTPMNRAGNAINHPETRLTHMPNEALVSARQGTDRRFERRVSHSKRQRQQKMTWLMLGSSIGAIAHHFLNPKSSAKPYIFHSLIFWRLRKRLGLMLILRAQHCLRQSMQPTLDTLLMAPHLMLLETTQCTSQRGR